MLTFLRARVEQSDAGSRDSVAIAGLLAAIAALIVAVVVGVATTLPAPATQADPADAEQIVQLAAAAANRLGVAMGVVAAIAWVPIVSAVGIVGVLVRALWPISRAASDRKRIASIERDMFVGAWGRGRRQ
ncbi:hypothetical protein [Microbacterium arborescens]